MAREDQTSVTQPAYGNAAPTAPSVRTQVIARQIPQAAINAVERTKELNSVMSQFFTSLSNSAEVVRNADLTARYYEIKQENEEKQTEATAIAMNGGDLTPEQWNNWNYVTPFRKAKASIAAATDASDFYNTVVKNTDLSNIDGVQKLATQTIQGKLKGSQDPEYSSYYTVAFSSYLQKPLADHRMQLYQNFRNQAVVDQDTSVGLDLNTDHFGPERAAKYITDRALAMGPEQAAVAQPAAIGKLFELGALHGKRDQVLSALQAPQPESPTNPKGLSYAGLYPEAFNKAAAASLTVHNAEFMKNQSESLFGIQMDLAQGLTPDANGVTGIERAFAGLVQHGSTYGTVDDSFKATALKVTKAMNKAGADLQVQSRLHAAIISGIADPKDVEKGGTQALNTAFARGGAPEAAKLALSWNMLPSDWVKSLDAQITNPNRPDVAATALQGIYPLWKQAPALFTGKMSEDADFIMRQADADSLAGKPFQESVVESMGALAKLREAGKDIKSIKPWDVTDNQGEKKFNDAIHAAIIDQTRSGIRGGFVGRQFDPGKVVVSDATTSAVTEAAKRYYVKFMNTSPGDAQSKAIKAASDAIGARTVALPDADGNYVLQPDNSPDTSQKWRRIFSPDGSLAYDPNDDFQKQLKALPFISSGKGATLVQGQDTATSGYYSVQDGLGRRTLYTPGQTISWATTDVSHDPSRPDRMVRPVETEHTILLDSDPAKAQLQLDALTDGSMFRVQRVLTAPGEHPIWELQARPTPPTVPTLDELRQKREGAILSQDAGKEGPDGQPRSNLANWKARFDHAFDVEKARKTAFYDRISTDQEINIDSGTIKNVASNVVDYLRDKGLVPASTGSTKPIPDDFASTDDAVKWIMNQADNLRTSTGGMPLEANDKPVDQRYAAMRRQFLETNESKRYSVYKDMKGLATVGIGFNLNAPTTVDVMKANGVNVDAVRSGKAKMTDDQINNVFEDLVRQAESIVSNKITVPLTSYQRLALVSLAYNNPKLIGPKLVDAINNRDWKAASAEIKDNSNKGSVKGIQFRRDREAQYFRLGSGGATQVAQVPEDGTEGQ